jgi:hypothetical protein
LNLSSVRNWFQKFAFKFNLYRYALDNLNRFEVGPYKSNAVDPPIA